MDGKWGCCESENQQQQEQQVQVAPFVSKTYQMVSDPRTDHIIRWGRMNNSFLVLDPSSFSQFLLPSYFKHSNFSSFVRQLNTYGFRKVDPDQWEFAHESFLRGQVHLLPNLVRRRKKDEAYGSSSDGKEGVSDEEEEALLQEIRRLRGEQRALDAELQSMNRRLEVTERLPQQMMTFLARVAKEPDLIHSIILSKKQHHQLRRQQLNDVDGEKKRRVVIAPLLSPPPSSADPVDPPLLETAVPSFEFCPFPQGTSLYSLVTPGAMASSSAGINAYSGGYDSEACGSRIVPEMDGDGGGGNPFAPGSSMLLLPEIEVPGQLAAFPFSLLGQ